MRENGIGLGKSPQLLNLRTPGMRRPAGSGGERWVPPARRFGEGGGDGECWGEGRVGTRRAGGGGGGAEG